MHFGEHLTLDGYGASEVKLNDKDFILSFIDELVKKLCMHKLSETQIFKAEDNAIKDPGGWSCFVIIQESHISLHTFPKRHFFSADVYTCKNGLDINEIKSIFMKAFELSDIETNFVTRGKRYPQYNL